MDTFLIKKLLKKFPCFKGVYPSDLLPYKQKLPFTIIINTDPSYKKGEHWVCISVDKTGFGYYFDSFGLPPLKEDIFIFLEAKCNKGWRYNIMALQDITSNTCGHYTVLFVIFRCQGLSSEYFLTKFSANSIENDEKMRKIFKNFSLAKEEER